MLFLFIAPTLPPASGVQQYGGGAKGFHAAAAALAGAGHSVHLLYTSSKPQLLFEVMQAGAMASLSYAAVEGLATWTAAAAAAAHVGPAGLARLHHHVSLSDVEPSTQQQLSTAMSGLCGGGSGAGGGPTMLSPPLQRLIDQCSSLLQQHAQQQQQQQQQQAAHRAWVVLDADSSQAPPPGCSGSLMEACSAACGPSRLLLLVQNIHFLPLGHQGTAPRRVALLAAWAGLGGVLCVSHFVARYVLAHTTPLGLPPSRVCIVHYAAFGAFGAGPFPDLGAATAQQLPWALSNAQAVGSLSSEPGRAHWRPTVCCLKLSAEKGGHLVLQLARALPQLHFLAVTTDAGLAQAAGAAALPNLMLRPPGDVDEVLRGCSLLLTPSVWQEAYGMVVTDALLRGVPTICSDQGGLTEAALGCAAGVVPVQPMLLPVDQATGQPLWVRRTFPQQQAEQLSAWVAAIQRLLGSRELYEACSAAGREAGARLVQHQPQLLGQLLAWLAGCQ
jgi:hypothetical protein